MNTATGSAAAVALFRLHVERHRELPINDEKRGAYQELPLAGVLTIGHSWFSAPSTTPGQAGGRS